MCACVVFPALPCLHNNDRDDTGPQQWLAGDVDLIRLDFTYACTQLAVADCLQKLTSEDDANSVQGEELSPDC